MDKRIIEKVILLGIAITIALSCQEVYSLSGIKRKTEKEIKIKQEWKGYYCGYTEPLRLVIYTQEQWKEIWEKVHISRFPKPELPKIDFAKKMVIAVFMGERSSGGYSIEIIKIVKTKEEIVVEVKEKKPDPESLRTMSLTQAYHIVVLKKSSLPVRFQSP